MDSRDYVFFKIIFTKNLCFYFSQILADGFLICFFFFLRSFLFLADVFYFSQIFANFIRGFSLMLCADSCGWFLNMFFLFLADFRKFYSQILADVFYFSQIFANFIRGFSRMLCADSCGCFFTMFFFIFCGCFKIFRLKDYMGYCKTSSPKISFLIKGNLEMSFFNPSTPCCSVL